MVSVGVSSFSVLSAGDGVKNADNVGVVFSVSSVCTREG